MTIDELYETIIHTLVFKCMMRFHSSRHTDFTTYGKPYAGYVPDYVLGMHCYDFDQYTIYRAYADKVVIKRLI